MKISDYQAAYRELSSKASEVARALAFAGIAVCWIFRVNASNPVLPADLIPPVALFAVGLAFDLLHYVFEAAIWGSFARIQEKRIKRPNYNPSIKAPPYLNWPMLVFFWLKILSVAVGYIYIINFLFSKWIYK